MPNAFGAGIVQWRQTGHAGRIGQVSFNLHRTGKEPAFKNSELSHKKSQKVCSLQFPLTPQHPIVPDFEAECSFKTAHTQ